MLRDARALPMTVDSWGGHAGSEIFTVNKEGQRVDEGIFLSNLEFKNVF